MKSTRPTSFQVQIHEILSNVQPLSVHLRAGPDRPGPPHGRQVPDEAGQHGPTEPP